MNTEEKTKTVDESKFDTVLLGNQIDNITITGQLKRPSLITICLKNGETASFKPEMDIWRGGITAAIRGRSGIKIEDDGQTIEDITKKEQHAD